MKAKEKLKKVPPYRFIVFVEMTLCYVLLYAGIQMVATLGADIMSYLNVSESELSIFQQLEILLWLLFPYLPVRLP